MVRYYPHAIYRLPSSAHRTKTLHYVDANDDPLNGSCNVDDSRDCDKGCIISGTCSVDALKPALANRKSHTLHSYLKFHSSCGRLIVGWCVNYNDDDDCQTVMNIDVYLFMKWLSRT